MFELVRAYGKKRGNEGVTVDISGPNVVDWRGKRIDLTTGEPLGRAAHFYASTDGRHLNYADGAMKLSHADGRSVTLPYRMLPEYPLAWVGRWLVFQEDDTHKQDLAVIDTETGELRGRLEGMLADENKMKYPLLFEPRDGRTLWLGEGTQLRAFDVASLKWTKTVLPPRGARFGPFVVLEGGEVVATLEDKKGQALVLLSPDGTVKKTSPLVAQTLGKVGAYVVAFIAAEKRFAVLDAQLDEVASVPHTEDFAVIKPLLADGQWLAVGFSGQWFHFGPRGLAPKGVVAPKKPASKKKR
jgi:hypothetical protein